MSVSFIFELFFFTNYTPHIPCRVFYNVFVFPFYRCRAKVISVIVQPAVLEQQKWNIYGQQQGTLFLTTKETKKF
jgi:hypothetical protein